MKRLNRRPASRAAASVLRAPDYVGPWRVYTVGEHGLERSPYRRRRGTASQIRPLSVAREIGNGIEVVLIPAMA